MVVAQIVDAAGRIVPTAGDEVTFSLTGPGRVIGVGNGDPSSHEADRASVRHAFNGLCMALVQSTKSPGGIAVNASAPGLARATATVTAAPAAARPVLSDPESDPSPPRHSVGIRSTEATCDWSSAPITRDSS